MTCFAALAHSMRLFYPSTVNIPSIGFQQGFCKAFRVAGDVRSSWLTYVEI